MAKKKFTKKKAEDFYKKLLGHSNYIEYGQLSHQEYWRQNWGLFDGEVRYIAYLKPSGHIKLECFGKGELRIEYYDFDTLEYDKDYTDWIKRQPIDTD